MEARQIDFTNIYIERCDKETEELLSEEGQAFLQNRLDYLHMNKHEFVYVEANLFHELGIEGLSLEVDDVFGTYNVMLGLKLQKKLEAPLKAYLNSELHSDEIKYGLIFDPNEGLWNVNFTLNYVSGFREEMSFQDTFNLLYSFLFNLVEKVK